MERLNLAVDFYLIYSVLQLDAITPGDPMKRLSLIFSAVGVVAVAMLLSYQLGQSKGFGMGFTQGMYSFAQTADNQRKQANGDVLFTGKEWPDTLRGLDDLRKHSGAAGFQPWFSTDFSEQSKTVINTSALTH